MPRKRSLLIAAGIVIVAVVSPLHAQEGNKDRSQEQKMPAAGGLQPFVATDKEKCVFPY